jgi:transposase
MITAQFCVNGNAKQMDIVRAFGVTKISVKRAVKRYREQGPERLLPAAQAARAGGVDRGGLGRGAALVR